ncbi:phosphotransferase [Tsuneonella sp. SYSU-LHT278]|uniref:phosphotransferase n=1 Tax=Tsuneonella sediminis TaxID=3416089 RepID=UPI003F7A0488
MAAGADTSRTSLGGAGSMEVDVEALRYGLEQAARDAGLAGACVAKLARLGGGASKQLWGFDLAIPGEAPRPLVLRRNPPGAARSSQALGSVAAEARLIRLAGEAGVPVPAIAFVVPDGSPVGDAYGMARLEGETLGPRVVRSPALAGARATMARQCGDILARLHAVAVPAMAELEVRSADRALAGLEQRYRDTSQPRPAFEFALRWLKENLPRHGELRLLHGDFRTGNLVVGPDGIRAVLDWELAHVGVPASDLAWLCVPSWRFQRPDLPVGGFGTREDLIAGYERAGGAAVDRGELHAWEVYQTMNWGTMCAGAARAFMDGARSVEGAVIARRASETEFDLMRMLAPGHPAWRTGIGATRTMAADPPAPLILAEVRAALERGVAPGFAQRVAANALGIAEREIARGPLAPHDEMRALADHVREGPADDAPIERLIELAIARIEIDQPGYPPYRAWKDAIGG